MRSIRRIQRLVDPGRFWGDDDFGNKTQAWRSGEATVQVSSRFAKAKKRFRKARCVGFRDFGDPADPCVLRPKKCQTLFPKHGRGGRGGVPLLATVGEEFTKPDAAADDRMEAQGNAQGEPYNPLKAGLRGLEDKGEEAQIPW